MSGPLLLMMILAALVLIPAGVIILLYVLVPAFKGLGWLLRHVFSFIFGELGDALRILGALITQIFLVPFVIGNIVIGRWSAAAHYGRAINAECKTAMGCLYRVVIGHPARLLGLKLLMEGLEHRLPEVVAAAPTADRPNPKRAGQFDGYTIVGSLAGGGSGGKLYVAEPDALKAAGFARAGMGEIRQVVIKTFSLKDGSSLPQIVRESRALDAAKRLGLVLEHELTDDRFFYVMRFVPGESLGLVTQRLHAMSGGDGLAGRQLDEALAYAADLISTLEVYHKGGLWHKDVKPDNIIVDRGGGRAHLVDFGLVTPLRSSMTLTTHGTEYFRDPEMVRLALKGVKVHEVDGAKFDIYAAGAVLYSVIENSFPAHGGLSQLSKRCPEAVRWIVRRAMTEYDKRYGTASEMLADLRAVLSARDAFAVKPIDLPSVKGGPAPTFEPAPEPFSVQPAAYVPPRHAEPFTPEPAPAAGPKTKPRIRVASWWSGRYVVEDAGSGIPHAPANAPTAAAPFVRPAAPADFRRTPRPRPVPGGRSGLSAGEQVERARARAHAARTRALDRVAARRRKITGEFKPGVNAGVAVALFLFLGACVALVAGVLSMAGQGSRAQQFVTADEDGVRIRLGSMGDIIAVAPDAPAAPLPLPPAASVDKASFRVDTSRAGGASPAGPAPVDGRVLVISDLQPPLAEDVRAEIETALNRLKVAGFTLLGNFPGNTATEDEIAHQDELAADVRKERALAPLDSAEAGAILAQWLSEQEDVDLILWLEGDKEGDRTVPRASLFAPRDDDGGRGPAVLRYKIGVRAIKGE